MHNLRITIFLLIFFGFFFLFAGIKKTKQNFEFIGDSKRKLTEMNFFDNSELRNSEFGTIVIEIAKRFIDTEYESGTLEGQEEVCRIDASGLDCVTFFELSLNLARMFSIGDFDIDNLPYYITSTRYRNGTILDYSSRLHYTSDWIFENQKKGIIDDLTEELGGKEIKFNLYFMSKNSNLYPNLSQNPNMLRVIAEKEKEINSRKYYLVESNKIKSIEKKLKNGDIIAIATSKGGLDYSHIGLIYINEQNEARFLHASSKLKRVLIDTTISEYIKSNSSNIGITVLRPILPKEK